MFRGNSEKQDVMTQQKPVNINVFEFWFQQTIYQISLQLLSIFPNKSAEARHPWVGKSLILIGI